MRTRQRICTEAPARINVHLMNPFRTPRVHRPARTEHARDPGQAECGKFTHHVHHKRLERLNFGGSRDVRTTQGHLRAHFEVVDQIRLRDAKLHQDGVFGHTHGAGEHGREDDRLQRVGRLDGASDIIPEGVVPPPKGGLVHHPRDGVDGPPVPMQEPVGDRPRRQVIHEGERRMPVGEEKTRRRGEIGRSRGQDGVGRRGRRGRPMPRSGIGWFGLPVRSGIDPSVLQGVGDLLPLVHRPGGVARASPGLLTSSAILGRKYPPTRSLSLNFPMTNPKSVRSSSALSS